jgi:hypothetical protein
MTSKTNNEEYHCEPLDREEPSAEPINLNSDNEEPEDLDFPNADADELDVPPAPVAAESVAEPAQEEEEGQGEEAEPEPEETRTKEQKARRLILDVAFADLDLPDAETLSASCGVAARYASLYDMWRGDGVGHKTDDIAEAIETCHRLAKGKTRLNLVGAYNVTKYIAEYQARHGFPCRGLSRAEALRRLNLRGVNNTSAAQYAAFATIIDFHKAYKFLYTCSVPWRKVRELLPRKVLANAFDAFAKIDYFKSLLQELRKGAVRSSQS